MAYLAFFKSYAVHFISFVQLHSEIVHSQRPESHSKFHKNRDEIHRFNEALGRVAMNKWVFVHFTRMHLLTDPM